MGEEDVEKPVPFPSYQEFERLPDEERAEYLRRILSSIKRGQGRPSDDENKQ